MSRKRQLVQDDDDAAVDGSGAWVGGVTVLTGGIGHPDTPSLLSPTTAKLFNRFKRSRPPLRPEEWAAIQRSPIYHQLVMHRQHLEHIAEAMCHMTAAAGLMDDDDDDDVGAGGGRGDVTATTNGMDTTQQQPALGHVLVGTQMVHAPMEDESEALTDGLEFLLAALAKLQMRAHGSVFLVDEVQALQDVARRLLVKANPMLAAASAAAAAASSAAAAAAENVRPTYY
ncbi:hypothetical protein HK105_203625 [Polyrhizophydium stewartii]|uniref:Uncharacterized protein n=1 Tax=Polyrhizophydium stewartii TaxID=2732419 RepID=A0ABR4NBM6_9FUNG|nr:hypothetical protein HK105_002842 [Polyrhizophydium stewartii]